MTIAGEDWTPDDLAAVVAAARAVLRSSRLAGRLKGRGIDPDDPLRVVVDGPALWALGAAVDAPYARGEWADPAVADDPAADCFLPDPSTADYSTAD